MLLQSDSSSLAPDQQSGVQKKKAPDLGNEQPRACAELPATEVKGNFIPRHFSRLTLIRSSLFVSAHIWDLGQAAADWTVSTLIKAIRLGPPPA